MNDLISFDESHWPILIIKHPEVPVNRLATMEYLATLQRYFEKQVPFIALFDVTCSRPPTAEHRFLVASWIKQNESLIKLNFLGTAYIMPGLVQRLALKMFLIFLDTTKVIAPVKVFSNSVIAMEWANKRLKKRLPNFVIAEAKK
jgi:hypothetical protein